MLEAPAKDDAIVHPRPAEPADLREVRDLRAAQRSPSQLFPCRAAEFRGLTANSKTPGRRNCPFFASPSLNDRNHYVELADLPALPRKTTLNIEVFGSDNK